MTSAVTSPITWDFILKKRKLQDDIRVLREQIANNKGGTISIQDLESALVKTEEGLQVNDWLCDISD